MEQKSTSWWFQPTVYLKIRQRNMLVKLDHFTNFRDEHTQSISENPTNIS